MGSIQHQALSRTPAPGLSKEKMDSRSSAAALEEAEVDPTMKTIYFTNVDNLFLEVDCAKGDALLVQRMFEYPLSGPHEQLHSWLYNRGIYDAIRDMGLGRGWRDLTASAFSKGGPYYSSGGGGGSGEGDSSGAPMPDRDYPGSFPTIVIEGGYSRSLAQLRQKARFWFDISNHDIKIVILAKLILAQNKIILERWEERQRDPRMGATTTRRGSEWVASCHQEITISKSSISPPAYEVTSGDLVLSFRQLFLRDPRAGEGDVVIPVTELQWYAAEVWAEVRNEIGLGQGGVTGR
ncbi:dead deah box dna helicase [Trichoderma arundinaceum]|uniref:Dead deah box dna helicase n=1 Tax=Trichoderma arundinaceum TaxID=490622 RepID=A0A395NI58_TRIAR|nr:dead deah box dna helicase [Trichoderma arundinaceum]